MSDLYFFLLLIHAHGEVLCICTPGLSAFMMFLIVVNTAVLCGWANVMSMIAFWMFQFEDFELNRFVTLVQQF